MFTIKSHQFHHCSHLQSGLCCIPITAVLTLELAIAPNVAGASIPQRFSSDNLTAQRSPSVPLKEGEINQLLAPLAKGGWGNRTTQLAQSPPPRRNPSGSSAGGRRDSGACPQDAATPTTGPILTALSPITKPGLTLAERPTFLVYVPKTSAKTAEFSLRLSNNRGLYRTSVALPPTPGIVSISTPSQAPPLELGQQYTWSFAIVCDPADRVNDRFVTGTVQRTELDPTRLRQIQQASAKERVALYQKADIWYEALPVLLELQRTQPSDLSIRALWDEFLQSGGVSLMVK